MSTDSIDLRCPQCGALLAKPAPVHEKLLGIRCRRCKEWVYYQDGRVWVEKAGVDTGPHLGHMAI